MDWMIITAAVLGGWAMLSVLTGERQSRQKQISDANFAAGKAAAEQAAK